MVHRRVLGKVKSERVEGANCWKVGRIINHEGHSEFINRFVQRQKEDARRESLKK